MTTDNPHNCRIALTLAHGGIPVIPLAASGPWRKKPLTAHGHHDATTNQGRIHEWWARNPDALVGLPAGPPCGLWVLDVDGREGRQNLNSLLIYLGLNAIVDLTPIVTRTPSDGLHLYFRFEPGTTPRNRSSDIARGLDTRGVDKDGRSAGYIIAPGTILPNGRCYRLVDASELSLAACAP